MVGSMASSRHGAGQKDVYLGFPESGTELYISQRLIKANPIRLHASLLHIIRGKLHPAVLPAFIPPTFRAVRATKFVSEANLRGLLSYMTNSPQHSKFSVLGQL